MPPVSQKEPYALSVVMPVYNEADVISTVVEQYGKILERFKHPEFVVVNDCSTDGTLGILQELAKRYLYLRVVHHEKNKGFGPTLLHALREGRGEYVFYSDSDNQFAAEDFWLVWKRMQQEKADLAIGYRALRKDSRFRLFITFMLKIISFTLFGVWLPDGNSPFRIYTRKALQIILPKIPQRPIAPSAPMTITAYKQHMRVVWVPVRHFARLTGTSVFNSWRMFKLTVAAFGELVRFRFIV